MRDTAVILIGGTSHSGKTTVARAMSANYGCDLHSSDRLAKHPGRPWVSSKGTPVPPHVEEHYSSLNVDELLADVLNHYEINVIPQVRDLVHRYGSGLEGRCAVIEGSALWPEFVEDLARRPSVEATWLVASDQLLQQRIYSESNYANAGPRDKLLIDRFLQRTLAYSDTMTRALEELDLPSVTVDSESPADLARVLWRPA